MDPINQTSDNSISGHPAADDIPNDGTGMLNVPSASCQLLTRWFHRRYQARSLALALQGLVEEQILQGPAVDQDN